MEQFGTPEEVYTRPATTFVASFIGSPPMNLLRNAPDARPGTTVGIRPEHLDITRSGWALRVEAVEMLGAERLVYGRWLHGRRRDGDRPDRGSTCRPGAGRDHPCHAAPDRLHLFDASTGKRLYEQVRTDTGPWPYPRWIAHRGAGKLAPENTLAAFRLGAAARLPDVRMRRQAQPGWRALSAARRHG
jgi:hypothetical protein